MKTKTSLALTLPVILAPIIYGVAVYPRLPQQLATHWGVSGEVNGTMPRALMVFGLPLMMAVFQLLVVLVPRQAERAVRFERVVAWILPVITVVAYVMTIQFNLGHDVDIRRIAILLVSAIFIAMGNYLPTVPADYNRTNLGMRYLTRKRDYRRVVRRLGFVMVLSGLAMLASLFFPPLVSAIVLGIIIVLVVVFTFV